MAQSLLQNADTLKRTLRPTVIIEVLSGQFPGEYRQDIVTFLHPQGHNSGADCCRPENVGYVLSMGMCLSERSSWPVLSTGSFAFG